MHHFEYKNVEGQDLLHAEGVNLSELAQRVGTPFYCYSEATLKRHYRVFNDAFAEIPHLVCFSTKACSNLAILNLFAGSGSGFDIVSGGELDRVLKAGGDAAKVVFSGVGKKPYEMVQALRANILFFNVESEAELLLLNDVAKNEGKIARITLRVNPDIDPKTHPYISTGLRKAKFGIDIAYARDLFRKAKALAHLEVVGVDCHIGSQLTEMAPFVKTLESIASLIGDLRQDGLDIRYLDIGGGLGITYQDEKPPHPSEYAKEIIPHIKKLGVTLVMEPGRVIAGNAGILVSRTLYTKKTETKNFVIVDAAMNDLMRPALYQAHQDIWPVIKTNRSQMTADIVGPICETGDFLALDRKVPPFEPGDLLAVMGAGAYGFSMSSTYNTRPKVAEVLVSGDQFEVIRSRETVATLLHGERINRPGQTFHLPFTKMHGNGNDFIVIDSRNLNDLPWVDISRHLCDRHFGIGADQVLLLKDPPVQSKDIVATMGIYDADGSEVEMCGNGLRALMRYLQENHLFQGHTARIATCERVVSVQSLGQDQYCVDMGEPILEGKKIPVAASGKFVNHNQDISGKTYTLTAVSMGNPHAVIYLDQAVKDYPVKTAGPVIETDGFFPNRVNVEFVEVLNRHEVNCRIWERGTGETLACGSGLCAVVVAGVLTDRTDRQIKIHVPGGTLELEWREANNHVYLTGEAQTVFSGDVDLNQFEFWRTS